jgi:hypothetical protein
MHRSTLIAGLAATAALAVPSLALADDPPPAFAPPAPAPVVDNASAGAFAKIYVARNASSFLRQDRRRVRVVDAQASCLTSPFLATRFGCVFTLRAFVIQRRNGWDNWGHDARKSSQHGNKHRNRHFRVRQFGCLGFLRINGGPAVTPSAQLVQVECARVPRGDSEIEEPTPTT